MPGGDAGLCIIARFEVLANCYGNILRGCVRYKTLLSIAIIERIYWENFDEAVIAAW